MGTTLMTPDPAAPATDPATSSTPNGDPAPNTAGDAAPAPPAPPAGDAPPAPAAGDPAPSPTPEPVVPETYTLALSENSTLDPAVVERASSLAKELKLTNDAAQRVLSAVETETAAHLEVIRAADAPNGEAWKARVQQYERDALADPDLGAGDPAKLEQIAQRARLVAEKIGGKDILEFLGATGMGSSAPFLKMFGVTIYQKLGEGEFVSPNSAGKPGSKDPAEILFGGKSATTKE